MTQMDSLLHLNQVESQVRGLRSRLDSAQRYLDTQTQLLADLNQTLQELETRKLHIRATIANSETETATIDERIEKLRDELNNAVTNKQYSAVLTELNTVKVKRGEIEDEILKEMESVESLDAEIESIEQQVVEREKVHEQATRQLAERQDEVGDRLTELETERDEAASAVPEKALSIFEELADIYEGESVGEVLEINRRHREYVCSICNIQLPFELVSLLMSGQDTLVRCSSCTRILFLQEDLKGELSKK